MATPPRQFESVSCLAIHTLTHHSCSLLECSGGPRKPHILTVPPGQFSPMTHHRFSKRKIKDTKEFRISFQTGEPHRRELSAKVEVWGPKTQCCSGHRGPLTPACPPQVQPPPLSSRGTAPLPQRQPCRHHVPPPFLNEEPR